MNDPYVDYLVTKDLILSKQMAINPHFERIVTRLMATEAEILKTQKVIEEGTIYIDPEAKLQMEMKRNVLKHTCSLLKSV